MHGGSKLEPCTSRRGKMDKRRAQLRPTTPQGSREDPEHRRRRPSCRYQACKRWLAGNAARAEALHIKRTRVYAGAFMVVPANGVTWKEFFLALKQRFIKDKLMDVAGSVSFFG